MFGRFRASEHQRTAPQLPAWSGASDVRSLELVRISSRSRVLAARDRTLPSALARSADFLLWEAGRRLLGPVGFDVELANGAGHGGIGACKTSAGGSASRNVTAAEDFPFSIRRRHWQALARALIIPDEASERCPIDCGDAIDEQPTCFDAVLGPARFHNLDNDVNKEGIFYDR